MRMKLDQKVCTGCYACYVACIAEHHEPWEEQAQSRRVIKKVTEPGFEKYICTGCTHCGACIEACPAGAIYRESEFGLVLADRDVCIGCRQCESACPQSVIKYADDGKVVKCDGCIERLRQGREAACVRVCCVKAVTSEKTETVPKEDGGR